MGKIHGFHHPLDPSLSFSWSLLSILTTIPPQTTMMNIFYIFLRNTLKVHIGDMGTYLRLLVGWGFKT